MSESVRCVPRGQRPDVRVWAPGSGHRRERVGPARVEGPTIRRSSLGVGVGGSARCALGGDNPTFASALSSLTGVTCVPLLRVRNVMCGWPRSASAPAGWSCGTVFPRVSSWLVCRVRDVTVYCRTLVPRVSTIRRVHAFCPILTRFVFRLCDRARRRYARAAGVGRRSFRVMR